MNPGGWERGKPEEWVGQLVDGGKPPDEKRCT